MTKNSSFNVRRNYINHITLNALTFYFNVNNAHEIFEMLFKVTCFKVLNENVRILEKCQCFSEFLL